MFSGRVTASTKEQGKQNLLNYGKETISIMGIKVRVKGGIRNGPACDGL